MKKILLLLGLLLPLACGREQVLTLHYNSPAQCFEEALPIGNGRIGAMVYGKTNTETLSLNDITLWTGEPDTIRYQKAQHLQPIREALDNEDYKLADKLQLNLQGHYSETYQPLGTLEISFPEGEITDYQRQLDISNAIATVSYKRNGKAFRADYLASAPDNVIAIRLQSDEPIVATIRLKSQLPHRTETTDGKLISDGYTAYHALPGYYEAPQHYFYDPEKGIHYRTVISCAQAQAKDSTLTIDNCIEALIIISNRTSFNGFDKNPVTEGKEYKEAALKDAAKTNWDKIKNAHTKDYKALFDRVSISLGTTPEETKALPTDLQLKLYSEGEPNPELEALYFQYGRYLLISSSRTEGVPANLQGLWNQSMDPPWSSNYTTNINLEENYWAAEATALPELHQSLLGFLRNLQSTGENTAKGFYGVQNGWCLGQNSDIWAMTCPVGLGVGDPSWANWNMGGAWLATHIWEHWLFTRSKEDLERDYPALKGAAQFCMGILTEKDGELITSPSTSPENLYKTPDGYIGETAYGCTADLAIIRECLTDAAQAAIILGDEDFAQQAQAILPKLRPYHIGQDGNLQEWYHDWADWDPRHRHQSHLIGLYPGHHIQPGTAFAQAARRTLEVKGFETTGWSCGWRVNLYARLQDGENAYKMYRRLLKYVEPGERKGGTYPNLMDAHPPFQIDGNFGGCAGVVEMLVQSDADKATPLPALPKAWPDGYIKGVKTRTGKSANLEWKDGKVVKIELK